jgi:hypothetical protein
MNDVVVPWCRAQKIEVMRSRAYKNNDQAFVQRLLKALRRKAAERVIAETAAEGREAKCPTPAPLQQHYPRSSRPPRHHRR